jgi:hypothetical protein
MDIWKCHVVEHRSACAGRVRPPRGAYRPLRSHDKPKMESELVKRQKKKKKKKKEKKKYFVEVFFF